MLPRESLQDTMSFVEDTAFVHARRKEWKQVPVNVVLFSVAVFIAWGRFGSYPL